MKSQIFGHIYMDLDCYFVFKYFLHSVLSFLKKKIYIILGASQTVPIAQGLPDPVSAAEAGGKARQPVQRQRLPLSEGKTTLEGGFPIVVTMVRALKRLTN